MYLLRSHGIEKDKNRFVGEGKEDWRYEQQYLGLNYRMNDIQASLGVSQAGRLKEVIKERRDIHARYNKEFRRRELPLKILDIPENVKSALHLCIIQLDINESSTNEDLFKYLRKNNVGVQVHYTPIHLQPFYRRLGFKEGDFPNSELFEKKCLSIPIYPGLKFEEQSMVIELIDSFFGR